MLLASLSLLTEAVTASLSVQSSKLLQLPMLGHFFVDTLFSNLSFSLNILMQSFVSLAPPDSFLTQPIRFFFSSAAALTGRCVELQPAAPAVCKVTLSLIITLLFIILSNS